MSSGDARAAGVAEIVHGNEELAHHHDPEVVTVSGKNQVVAFAAQATGEAVGGSRLPG
jgi:hypothetical protein